MRIANARTAAAYKRTADCFSHSTSTARKKIRRLYLNWHKVSSDSNMALKHCKKALFLLCLATYVQWSSSWPTGITDLSVCSRFHVAHSSAQEVSASSVLVTLKQGGSDASCVEPDTLYHVEFKSNERTLVDGNWVQNRIKGILVKPSGNRLGDIQGPPHLPKNTVHDACGSGSISHSCRVSSGCFLGDEGKWLNISYKTLPSINFPQNIIFRYVVVLSKEGGIGKFVSNRTVTFPVCPPKTEPPTTTTPKTQPSNCSASPESLTPHETNSAHYPVKHCSDFKEKDGAKKQTGNCGKLPYFSNETHVFMDTNTTINYTCHTNVSVKKVACEPTCLKDGQQWCCRNVIARLRPRDFQCTATLELNSGVILNKQIERKGVKVLQTKQCECFLCKDVVCGDNCSGQNPS